MLGTMEKALKILSPLWRTQDMSNKEITRQHTLRVLTKQLILSEEPGITSKEKLLLQIL